ncbi:biosynthetic peptidoglycan transglycosylase [Variovorax sp. J22R133]|uniref:biosynthetic peptidoglycan transglycosylase n=1 Tax=Variovorax brevis TaxID=3053503 RepID=UPI00257544E3|nr:biosynthetic peptidoglycan transglycosylase [Variovorax sp. J22R133]MDM0111716.1 biosynthetic peptidoglycan transglycosylase [Variovorax sp. J22R133]
MKKALRLVLYMLAALFVTAGIAVFLIVKLVLAPSAGEWAERVKVGPIGFDVGVPTVLRLVTASWFAPQLAGHSVDTRFGTVRFGWVNATNVMELQCAPCSMDAPEFGEKPLSVDTLMVTVRRDVDAMFGTITATPTGSRAGAAAVKGRWNGRLSQKGLQLNADIEDAPIAQWYQILVPALPELQRARIGGTASVQAQLTMPEKAFTLKPRLSGFTVEGLGAQAVIDNRPGCGVTTQLSTESWLARAVVAAQDADFYQHEGYQPDQFSVASLPSSGKKSDKAAAKAPPPDRFQSGTLNEQLARLLLPAHSRVYARKMRDLLYAVEMDRTPGKARVVQAFMDNVPWGEQTCGAEAAARRYFRRSARSLEPAQAVWLATMLRDPQESLDNWRRDGRIDHARAKAVAEAIRSITPGQHAAVVRSAASAKFAPP